MKQRFFLISSLFTLLILTACTLVGGNGQTVLPNATSVYETISAQLTATSAAVRVATHSPVPPTQAATVSPMPSSTLTQATNRATAGLVPVTLTMTPNPTPCNLAAAGRPYVDITIADGERMSPGQAFSKTWRLLNAGSCTWTTNYAIVWFSGDIFSAMREQAFSSNVKPGDNVDITVDMVAPNTAGQHQSNWKLRDASGALFGIGPTGAAPFWVRIEVVADATATMTPQGNPTPTGTPQAIARGTFELEIGKPFNLDSGKLGTGAGDDLELQKSAAADFQLAPVNGARIVDFGTQTPNALECWNSPLTGEPVRSTVLNVGEIFCYRTNQGLPGYLRIRTITVKGPKVTIDYLTWAMP
jgi:hypothetical protein